MVVKPLRNEVGQRFAAEDDAHEVGADGLNAGDLHVAELQHMPHALDATGDGRGR